MDHYEIIITPDAEIDLNELDDYITYNLEAPDVAVSYLAAIRLKISELSTAPKRCQPLDDEPLHSRGVMRLNAKGFAVFYYVDEEHFEVYIQNVIYQKRDIPKVLAEMYSDID